MLGTLEGRSFHLFFFVSIVFWYAVNHSSLRTSSLLTSAAGSSCCEVLGTRWKWNVIPQCIAVQGFYCTVLFTWLTVTPKYIAWFCFQIVFAKDCGLAFYPQVTQRLPQSCATYFVVCHKLNDCFYLSKLSEVHCLSPRLSCLSLCKYPSLEWPISTVNIMRGNFLM